MNVTRQRVLLVVGSAALVIPAALVLGSRAGDAMSVPGVAAPPTAPATDAVAPGPRLVVPSQTLAPGASFRVKGTGFPPLRPGVVAMNGRHVSAIRTTKGGRFSLSVDAPKDARGDVRVTTTVAGISVSARVSLTGSAIRESSSATPNALAAPVVVMAVGDLTSTATNRDAIAVRNVVAAQRPARVLMLGDYQYQYGSTSGIRGGADRVWGPKPGGLWRRMMPTSGPTHDVKGCAPSDYDRYWGRSAMRPYSFNLGSWHIIQLPSAVYRYNCNPAAVLAWLRADLASHHNQCTLAFWHEPYWTRTTTQHGRTRAVKPWITALYRAGVDVVLNGHQHNYQRFQPQNPNDRIDRTRGIREFVVGSGGIGFYRFTSGPGNTAASSANTFGALKLVLRRGAYDWRFMRAGGAAFTDAGTARCH